MSDGRIDLRLLECLEVLISERHVTKAADRLGTSQPKLSGALARLRKLTGDPLLVRTPQGMVPTDLAKQLAKASGDFRRQWDELVDRDTSFVPDTAERLFRVHTGDFMMQYLLVSVAAELRKSAPSISMSISPPAMRAGLELLETGEVDVAIGTSPSTPKELYVSQLGVYNWSCIAAADHPRLSNDPTLAEFTNESHVVMTFGRSHEPWKVEREIDIFLANFGLHREVSVFVPSVLVIPEMVAASDLIAMVPTPLANSVSERLRLKVFNPPFPTPETSLSMSWHARTRNDPAHKWFRELLRKVARTI